MQKKHIVEPFFLVKKLSILRKSVKYSTISGEIQVTTLNSLKKYGIITPHNNFFYLGVMCGE